MKKLVQNEKHSKDIIWRVVLSLAIILAFVLIGSFKSGYHVDEISTMALSNHQYSGSLAPPVTDGVVYTGEQLWEDYLIVNEGDEFDYANVVVNQASDVHPPLYYFLVHTVFSLFPGTYSKWYAMSVNIVLAVVVFWQMVWLFQFFTKRKKLSVVFSLLFLFTMGFVNSVVFFRMYVLLAVWTNALAMLFCKYKPEEKGWKYYALLLLILVGGTMTQYYFTVFAFFACAIYALRVILKKNWKKLLLSCLSVGVSVGICTLLFPAMWTHVFGGYRGEEAFENLSSGNFWSSLWSYLDIVNLQVFGNLFLFLFFLAVVLYVVGKKSALPVGAKEEAFEYLQVVVPAIGYLLLIAQISTYKADRYVMNVMGLLYLAMFVLLIRLASRYSRQAVAGILAAAALVLFCSYEDGVTYLYTSEADNIATVESLEDDVPCLYIYEVAWKIRPSYLELADLNEVVFVKSSNLALLDDNAYQNYDSLLLYIGSSLDATQLLNQILEQNPELDSYTKLFSFGYATAYYLE